MFLAMGIIAAAGGIGKIERGSVGPGCSQFYGCVRPVMHKVSRSQNEKRREEDQN